MVDRNRALIELNLATFVFGFVGPLGKVIPLAPLPITFWRAVSAALFLHFLGRRLAGHSRIRSKKDLIVFLAIAVLISLQSVLFFKSVQTSTVAIAAITVYTYPILMVFLESWFFGRRIRPLDIGSAIIVLVGIFYMTPEHDLSNANFQGVVFGVLAGLTIPFIILMRKKFLVGRYTSWDITSYEFGLVSLILLPFVALTKHMSYPPTLSSLGCLLLLGLLATGLGRMLLVKSQAHLSGKTVGLVIILEAVYAIVFALVFLLEVPTKREILGGLMVVSVVLFETLSRKEDTSGSVKC